jgi:hypothetical protein
LLMYSWLMRRSISIVRGQSAANLYPLQPIRNLSYGLGLRDASNYSRWVEQTLDKLLSGQGRSPQVYKFHHYINCTVCTTLGKRVCPIEESLVFHSHFGQTFPTNPTLGAKTHKIGCHISILECVVSWLLASSVEAQWTNFCFDQSNYKNPLSTQPSAVVGSASKC